MCMDFGIYVGDLLQKVIMPEQQFAYSFFLSVCKRESERETAEHHRLTNGLDHHFIK